MMRASRWFGWLAAMTMASAVHAQPTLTEQERVHLQALPELRLCVDPDYLPFEAIDDNNRFVGISASFMAYFAETLGLRYDLQFTANWDDTLKLASQGGCDIVAMLNDSPSRREYLNFTQPYLLGDIVILTLAEQGYLDGVNMLRDKKVVLPRGWRVAELMQHNYPEISLFLVDDFDQALQAVADGKAYATMDNLRSAIWQLQAKGIDSLAITGQTPFNDAFRVGVRKDDPLLLSALDKAIASMPSQIRSDIIERGFRLPPREAGIPGWLWQIGAALLAFTLLLLWRQRTLRRFASALSVKNQELEQLSEHDHLTGCSNRFKLDRILGQEVERAQRYHRPLSVILYDLDHFKRINDHFGHLFGDAVLCATVGKVQQLVRQQDCLGRWGGEEFLIICPETNRLQAIMLAEKIRVALAGLRVHEGVAITASFGVAEIAEGQTVAQLIQQADHAMYAAKQAGRNTVHAATEAEMSS